MTNIIFPKVVGQNLFFLNSNIEEFSNLSLGIIIKALSNNKKVGFVDCRNKISNLNSFFENLVLSKNFENLKIDFFKFRKENILKSIVSNVEYTTLLKKEFFQSLNDYDYVIFENFSYENFSKEDFINFLENKNEELFVILNSSIKDTLKDLMKFIQKSYLTFSQRKIMSSQSKDLEYNFSQYDEILYLCSLGNFLRKMIKKEECYYFCLDKNKNSAQMEFLLKLKKFSKESLLYKEINFTIFDEMSSEKINLLKNNLSKNINVVIYGVERLKEISLDIKNSRGFVSIFSAMYSKELFDLSIVSKKIIDLEEVSQT